MVSGKCTAVDMHRTGSSVLPKDGRRYVDCPPKLAANARELPRCSPGQRATPGVGAVSGGAAARPVGLDGLAA